MAEVPKYSIRDALLTKDEELTDDPSLYGMSALTVPRAVNAMRTNMFTSHLRQFLTPVNPDFPYVFTGAENSVGENNEGSYKEIKHKSRVYKKIVKYEDILDKPNRYVLFYYDEENEKYKVVERFDVEDLTENFGFDWNNEVIDSLKEGDEIEPGTRLRKSTSYDKYDNYRYGMNATTMYTLEPYTSEDAAIVSESFANKFLTIETEKIEIKLNDNDFLLNLRGDKDHYKPLPDIGEFVDGTVASIRTQFNNQILYDFNTNTLNHIQDGDRTIFVNGNVEVIDYTIYTNNEDIEDNPFNEQINKYLRSQTRYWQSILDTCDEIIHSGKDFSSDVRYLRKRANEFLNKNTKWKQGDAAFSDMVIRVIVRKQRPLAIGQKITGRYGNKSVISQIRPDNEMPVTENGKRVDLLLNLLAIINRTTAYAIYELAITSICRQVRERMATLKTYKEKEELLFDILYMFNEKQHEDFYTKYKKLSTREKHMFIDDSIADGIYINQSPIHETTAVFYRLRNILAKYKWLKPDCVYIMNNGKLTKTLSKHWIGTMYVMKLKQSDFRGFSARSTGAIDIKDLPTRSYKSRNHMERHSDSAIRFGEYETLNFSIGVPTEDIALAHAVLRTSIKGRQQLVKHMFDDAEEDGTIHTKIDKAYTNRVAEIFNVIFKSLSLKVDFEDSDNVIRGYDNTHVKVHDYKGKSILCTDYEFYLKEQLDDVKEEILSENLILTDEQLKKEIKERLKHRKCVIGPLRDKDGNLILE